MISTVYTDDDIYSPVRKVGATVFLNEGANFVDSFTPSNSLKEITIERVAESNKFFGYGYIQKANVKLIDTNRNINITTANNLDIAFDFGSTNYVIGRRFGVTEVNRAENTNELSVTAYDELYNASKHTVAELDLEIPYTIFDFASAIAELLGLTGVGVINGSSAGLDILYGQEANFEGTETLREALTAIAEATQSIYYLNSNRVLTFKWLDKSGAAKAEITKERYITLESGENRRLSTITHVTELGDNVSATFGVTGTTQYIRDNPFLELREDIDTLLSLAIERVGGLTINQFSCEWRGNPFIEIGDKISLTTKDNGTVTSYLLDDVISYDGTLSQRTQWQYEDDSAEGESNPVSLGDALKQTYARVDKANKEIELLVSANDATAEQIAKLFLDQDEIVASVQAVEESTGEALEGVNSNISTLTSQVEAKMSAEDVTIQIQTALDDGVEKVVTSTGFTFNDDGLTISKSGAEMSTTITEDGMTVHRDQEAVLIADHEGVRAEDLHATTYLIVGSYSRFENYGERTGCFWIGG